MNEKMKKNIRRIGVTNLIKWRFGKLIEEEED